MLTVAASVTLGRLRYDTHAARVTLRRSILPALDRLEVRLPAGVRFEAVPGDDASIDLDGGEGAETALTGRVTSVARQFDAIDITAHDGGSRLAGYRPSLQLERVSVGDVVEQLCGDAGVDVGEVASGPTLTRYVADGRATAAHEVARLAAHFGAFAVIDGHGALHVVDAPSKDEAGLRYGRELLAIQVNRREEDPSSRTVVGEGAGGPDATNARVVIADFLAGSAPTPGPDARRRAEAELRTTDDARTASAAWTLRRRQAERRVHLRSWLVAALAPGMRVVLQDVPEELGLSAILLRHVVHRVDPVRGAWTEAWGTEDTGRGGLQDLLSGIVAGALGEIGSLL